MSSAIEDNVKKRFGSKLEAWWDSTHGVSTSNSTWQSRVGGLSLEGGENGFNYGNSKLNDKDVVGLSINQNLTQSQDKIGDGLDSFTVVTVSRYMPQEVWKDNYGGQEDDDVTLNYKGIVASTENHFFGHYRGHQSVFRYKEGKLNRSTSWGLNKNSGSRWADYDDIYTVTDSFDSFVYFAQFNTPFESGGTFEEEFKNSTLSELFAKIDNSGFPTLFTKEKKYNIYPNSEPKSDWVVNLCTQDSENLEILTVGNGGEGNTNAESLIGLESIKVNASEFHSSYCEIAEILVFNEKLGEDDRKFVNNYLYSKWSLSGADKITEEDLSLSLKGESVLEIFQNDETYDTSDNLKDILEVVDSYNTSLDNLSEQQFKEYIEIEGEVDTSSLGAYEVTYSYENYLGVKVSVQRKVVVVEPKAEPLIRLEAFNAASYLGEPTVNLYTDSEFSNINIGSSIEDTSAELGDSLKHLVEDPGPDEANLKIFELKISQIKEVQTSNSYFIASGSPFDLDNSQKSSLQSGKTYSLSFWVKFKSETRSAYVGYDFFTLNSEDGTKVLSPSSYRSELKKDNWHRVSGVFDVHDDKDYYVKFYLRAGSKNPLNAGESFLICLPQIEEKPYSSPYVSGERSQAEAWKDVSGRNNHVDFDYIVGTESFHYKKENFILPEKNAYLNFDGVNDYLILGQGSDLVSGNRISIESWFTLASLEEEQVFLTLSDPGHSLNDASLYITFDKFPKTINFGFKSGTYHNYTRLRVEDLKSENWYHLVTVFDGESLKIYLNGTSYTNSTDSTYGSLVNSGEFRVSGAADNSKMWQGKLSSLIIYNKDLSENEVISRYEERKNVYQEINKNITFHDLNDSFLDLYLDASLQESYLGEPTQNLLQDTDFAGTNWVYSNQLEVKLNSIYSPKGVDSSVISLSNCLSSENYLSPNKNVNQGNNVQGLLQDTNYAVTVYVKTTDSDFKISFKTGSDNQIGQTIGSYEPVSPDGQWHRVYWFFKNPLGSQCKSLSFVFECENKASESWFSAPQVEEKNNYFTPFTDSQRLGSWDDLSNNKNKGGLQNVLTETSHSSSETYLNPLYNSFLLLRRINGSKIELNEADANEKLKFGENGVNSFSIECWINFDFDEINLHQGIFDFGRYGLKIDEHGALEFWYKNNNKISVKSRVLNEKNWYHVVAVHKEGESDAIYLNGFLDASKNAFIDSTGGTPIVIGIDGSPDSFIEKPRIGYGNDADTQTAILNGKLSLLRIYSKDISDKAVFENYETTKNRFEGVLRDVSNENVVLDLDTTNIESYSGEPTVNIIPKDINSRFDIGNEWGTYNTNLYNGNNFWEINLDYVSDNIVTTKTEHFLHTFDCITPQNSGGGVEVGNHYFVKKISDTSFSLHSYNNSQDGSQGYIRPDGFHQVHESIANNQKINIYDDSFPVFWHGHPHMPNTTIVKELKSPEETGVLKGTRYIRVHRTRSIQRGSEGMSYGVNPSVKKDEYVSVSFWARVGSLNGQLLKSKNIIYSTYFGPNKQGSRFEFTCTDEWKRFSYYWLASETYSFIQYFWLSGDNEFESWYLDLADIQVETGKVRSTPYTLPSKERSSLDSWKDLTENRNHASLEKINRLKEESYYEVYNQETDSFRLSPLKSSFLTCRAESRIKIPRLNQSYNDYSLEFWVKIIRESGDYLIYSLNNFPKNHSYFLSYNPDSSFSFSYKAKEGNPTISKVKGSFSKDFFGYWKHVVITNDSSDTLAGLKIYTDGRLGGTGRASEPLNSVSHYIGMVNGERRSPEFEISKFRIFSKSLSNDEVLESYNYSKDYFSELSDFGAVSKINTNLPGEYLISYNVTDSDGNDADEITRTVIVRDPIPVLTLIGDEVVIIGSSSNYQELGAECIDPIDGDISDKVTIGGDIVDTSIPGTYYVIYNAKNSTGVEAMQIVREVIVQDDSEPEIELLGSDINIGIGESFSEPGYQAFDDVDGVITSSVQIKIYKKE